jgi:hypothetical protein
MNGQGFHRKRKPGSHTESVRMKPGSATVSEIYNLPIVNGLLE